MHETKPETVPFYALRILDEKYFGKTKRETNCLRRGGERITVAVLFLTAFGTEVLITQVMRGKRTSTTLPEGLGT